MDQDQILHDLTGIFRDVFDNPSLQLTTATTAQDVPGWDSMNHVTIVVSAEQHFGIKVQTAEIEGLQNVGQFVSLIESKLAKARR